MIVGVGVDVVEVERFRQTLDRYGNNFLKHVYSDEETAEAPEGAARVNFYAGRWAAKEAVAKALGTGIGVSCGWKDIRVVRGTDGKPGVRMQGAGAVTADRLGVGVIHISISHERGLACAAAVAEKADGARS